MRLTGSCSCCAKVVLSAGMRFARFPTPEVGASPTLLRTACALSGAAPLRTVIVNPVCFTACINLYTNTSVKGNHEPGWAGANCSKAGRGSLEIVEEGWTVTEAKMTSGLNDQIVCAVCSTSHTSKW